MVGLGLGGALVVLVARGINMQTSCRCAAMRALMTSVGVFL
jgi:hypothetical protein